MTKPSPPDPAESRPEIRAFMQEIKSRPNDDTPRLVLADWLQEHDDPLVAARGEMLRIQVLLHQLHAHDPRRDALRRRQNELFREHVQDWVGSLMEYAAWRFERGLLHLEARAPKFLTAEAAASFPPEVCEWVECLKVEDLQAEQLPRLAESPFLPHVHTLDLGGNRLRAEGLAAILHSPNVAHLRSLFLDGNRLGPDGTAVLAESPALTTLAELDLSKNRLGDEGARHLVGSPHLGNLATLWVRRNRIGEDGQAALRTHFGKCVYLKKRRRPEPE